MNNPNPIVEFAESNFRNRKLRFGIKQDDRRRHMYVIGKTGMGKTELLKNIAIQDIQDGRGLAFVDPHGDPVEELLDYIPKERIKDVVYINPFDLDYPIAFNVMERVKFEDRHLVADGLLSVFKKIWVDAWSARMEYILSNTILALLESPDSTLLGINRMMADKEYRKQVIENVTDPVVRAFWTQEFAKYTDRLASEATAAIQNKVGQFVSSPIIRNMVGQAHSNLDMRKMMDERKIILVNISKGRIGEDASRLLGALIITKLQLAAMSRVDIPEPERQDFTLVVDEFQNFATASFANILSEARKYHLNLIIAHQYVAQMEESVRDAVFGNVGTIITFRVGAEDAELLEKELFPEFVANDVVNLAKYNIYLKLMIDGVASRAFSATTIPPLPKQETNFREEIISNSREQFGTPEEEIRKKIAEWYGPLPQTESGGGSQQRFERRPDKNRTSFNDGGGRQRNYDQPQKTFKPQSDNFQQKSHGQGESNTNSRGVSLDSAFGKGAVDFRGRKIDLSKEKQKKKVKVDIKGLRDVLKQTMGE
ncbi:MAG: hypothetical protein COV29_01005 [Candidatus Yanofskybacteria bacterium CG10_big_fil_rev_8_21_14_0_10_36_16]|uniref:Type IV secretion system coupling protein TraD DNA-binding domain-containing protein n=1 Tax=Candidatus Yanofskybacteria bacterium CG10_big_fil_rev_8_21_14_0_10_36_16 TaxID=1975096 RepID=A0A2J0Q866_9BACT|nr:MAG: hypothetical protein COV29_01005 [Candidatus Yanofskybacteria bacterium CG10_big_fil_rev_8_21_14_0_10_36_16]